MDDDGDTFEIILVENRLSRIKVHLDEE